MELRTRILERARKAPRAGLAAVLLVVLIGGYYAVRALTANGNGDLSASGTIETVSANISPELAGRVKEVLVGEGQFVKAGDAVLVLDDALLQEQRKVAEAGLAASKAASQTAQNSLSIAKAQYQQTLETALAQGRKTRLQDWFSKDQQQFNQPNWYFTRQEQIQAVQEQIDGAKQGWDDAEAKLANVTQSLDKAEFLKAEKRVLDARIAYLVSKDVNQRAQNATDEKAPKGRYNRTHCGTNEGYQLEDRSLINVLYGCTGDQNLTYVSEQMFNDAQAELEDAQRAYDALLTTAAAQEVLRARAAVAVSQERYYAALDRLSALQTGDQAPGVTAAQGAVDQAQAAYNQSQQAVAQAQANVDLLDVQLEKLTVPAPMDGVILTRSVEPGEFVQPGAAALTIGNIKELTITVYVPEDRYGQISLGQKATVQVDSFPGESFEAEVTHIADQAEFTPRNVQTAVAGARRCTPSS